MRRGSLGLLGLALAASGALATPAIPPFGLSLADQDQKVRPGDDFFHYQNGTWIGSAAPDRDHPFVSYWRDVRNLAPGRLDPILGQLTKEPAGTSSTSKAAILYRDFLDTAAVEAAGGKPLQSEIASIRALRSPAAVAHWMGWMAGPGVVRGSNLRDTGGAGLFAIAVAEDETDPRSNAVHLYQDGLLMPDPAYYSKPEVADVRAAYLHYAETLLDLAGWPDAEQQAANVVAFETKLAAATTPQEQLVDPAKGRHALDLAGLRGAAPDFPWAEFLGGARLQRAKKFIVDDPDAFGRLAKIYAGTDMATLRARQVVALADARAGVLDHRFYDAKLAFRVNMLNTPSLVARTRKDGAERLVEAAMPDLLGAIYSNDYVSPELRTQIAAMGDNLRAALDARLARTDRLSPQSRAEARRKLAQMKIRIGVPPSFESYSDLHLPDAGLYADVAAVRNWQWNQQLASLGRPFDRTRWQLPPMFPQYLYDPVSNAAEVSVALFVSPFFDPEADGAINYGAVGTVVASQMMHAFDGIGSRFDSTGRLRQWMTGGELRKFASDRDTLANRLSALEPLPGVHPRGALLADEAWADIGSMEIALDAYHRSLGGQPSPVVGGLSGDQRFFLGRAQSWRARFTDDAVRNQLTQGSNAVPSMRVNVPTPNVDSWYDAFAVKAGDRLYLPVDKRVHSW